jgi:hypothetical protein
MFPARALAADAVGLTTSQQGLFAAAVDALQSMPGNQTLGTDASGLALRLRDRCRADDSLRAKASAALRDLAAEQPSYVQLSSADRRKVLYDLLYDGLPVHKVGPRAGQSLTDFLDEAGKLLRSKAPARRRGEGARLLGDRDVVPVADPQPYTSFDPTGPAATRRAIAGTLVELSQGVQPPPPGQAYGVNL